MVKPCLIIVFNHRYDKNIPVLEKIYAGRFSHIYFLVPFYDGAHPNVIPVYESSHYFQSFFAQGYSHFFKEEFTHYIFAGDDCILNPLLNEHNFLEETGLGENTDFIPEFIQFHKLKGKAWWHSFKGIDFFSNRKGAEIRRELPSRDEAVERFRKHGLDVQPVTLENIFGDKTPSSKKWLEYFFFKQYHWQFKWKSYKKGGRLELPYPVAGSYADLVVVTRESIYNFCRYCGIMAAAGLFVEIAIPTSLLLSSEKIKQEKDLRLQGKALWTTHEVEAVETENDRKLSSFLANFPARQLFYHPVKLSKWNNDL
jgi:hypothetical protein